MNWLYCLISLASRMGSASSWASSCGDATAQNSVGFGYYERLQESACRLQSGLAETAVLQLYKPPGTEVDCRQLLL
jgi:hypothetical protein